MDITAPAADSTEDEVQKPLPPSLPPRKSLELEKINETDRENEILDESNVLSSNAPVNCDHEVGLDARETDSDIGDNQVDIIVDAGKAQPLFEEHNGPTNTINTLPEVQAWENA